MRVAQAYGNESDLRQGVQESDVHSEHLFLVTKMHPSNFAHARLLMQWPHPSVPVAETLGAMEELQAVGKVKYIGVSTSRRLICRKVRTWLNRVKWGYLLTAYSPLAKGRVSNHGNCEE